jgi:hypothetical protein
MVVQFHRYIVSGTQDMTDYMEIIAGMAEKVYLNSGEFLWKSYYIEYISDAGIQIMKYTPA